MRFFAFATLPIIVAVAAVYWPVFEYGFLAWDDDVYVTDHPLVLTGLTARGVGEAFTSFACSNWHPLTIISHMVDVSVFGEWAGGHHLVNVVLHAVNALLVFVLASRLTSRWPESLLIAALFAIHPQRVESVAWISERKDLLCGIGCLVSILAYLHFTGTVDSRTRVRWYAAAVGSGIVACLAKPMAVTLPWLLVLIDVWPLGRWGVLRQTTNVPQAEYGPRAGGWGMMLEKVPFFVMAGLTAGLTMLAQDRAMASVDALPLGTRIANAIVAYSTYVQRAVWPTNLAAFYPHAGSSTLVGSVGGVPSANGAPELAFAEIAFAAALLVTITVGVVALLVAGSGRGMPWPAFGWAWFLVMLVPVIGLVQVGSQGMADRYYYLPGIGLEFGIVMALGEALRRGISRWESLRHGAVFTAAGVAVVVVMIFALLAHRQVITWRTDESLWRHATAVVPRNAVAESLLASALAAEGRTAEAVEHHIVALRFDPALRDSLANLGLILSDGGRPADALPFLERASALWPKDSDMSVNLAICLARLGQTNDAKNVFQRVVALDPGNAKHRYNFAMFLEQTSDLDAALQELEVAMASDPAFEPARAARRRIFMKRAQSR